jgi:hypothetical protein
VNLNVANDGITAAMIASGTVGTSEVDADQVQLRVNGTCPAGESIRVIHQDGSVQCEADDAGAGGVTAVMATAPLVSSGGTTPDISLPHVKIESTNTASGVGALLNNTSGLQNTASGVNALSINTAGSGNTASGFEALRNNSTGSLNTGIGYQALFSNSTGNGNTACGDSALWNNTTGHFNTVAGYFALASNSTGSYNAAAGADALFRNTTGSQNTASGVNALLRNTTGSQNTAIGSNADVSENGLTNATAIGAGAVVNGSNKVRLGNSSVTVIEGQVAFTAVSDRNQKENFSALDGHAVLEKVRTIPVRSWNYIGQDPTQFRHYGPVAQDFFAAFGRDEVGTIGTPTTINSGDMDGILLSAVQALEKRTLGQREETQTLREEYLRLREENARLNARLEQIERVLQPGEGTAPQR